jgi:hypothetical protein
MQMEELGEEHRQSVLLRILLLTIAPGGLDAREGLRWAMTERTARILLSRFLAEHYLEQRNSWMPLQEQHAMEKAAGVAYHSLDWREDWLGKR